MHSSSTILSTLKESDQTISRQALLLAKDVLTGAIENETVFLQRVRAIYPEFSFYSGTVEGSPDGTTRISGSEQEQRRTELSFLCLYWILRGDYDKLTKLQTPPDKLTYETFLILQKKITTLLHNEEAVDAMFATMAIHDLGKVVWFQNKVKEISKSSSNDHDEILLFALEHCPDILPSYSRIAQSYQDVIRNAWRMRFNLGQFVQGENLPFNLTNCMDAARNNPHIINYFFLHEMLDLGGVTGHVSLEGSKTLNEANCFAYEAAWNAVIDPTLKNEVAVYNAYLQVRGQRLGLDAHDPEQRAVIRLCCNARVFERDQGRLALATFHSLPVSCQTILNKEMNVSGLEGEKGVLLYYAPQTLVNLIENKTGEQRKLGLQRGFELLARLYMDARIHIKKQKGNGVYTLLISAVSNCAAKDPDMLKYKDIEIDFNAGKVISVADHNSIGTETFPAMKSLGDLPGQRLVVIGIGGGSDGIQAKLIAELAEKHGKQVVGTVSVRTKYTTFDSRDVPKGTERSIKSPADALGNDTYLLAPHSEGVHFDRFLENAVADSKTSYLVLDAMKESQTEEENVANLSQQFQQLFQRLQPDMIIALDTGGDALYQENVATESSKSTPDQDLRVIKALNLLNIPSLTMEVATGVDSPVNAQQVLNKAEASYFSPSSEDRRYLLARYHELGMDAATANEKRFGKTALAWQIAMNNGEEKGYHFLPVPASRILDEKSPWNPVVFLEPAMQGVFVMDLRKHVAAISQQPVAKEVEPSPQARL